MERIKVSREDYKQIKKLNALMLSLQIRIVPNFSDQQEIKEHISSLAAEKRHILSKYAAL